MAGFAALAAIGTLVVLNSGVLATAPFVATPAATTTATNTATNTTTASGNSSATLGGDASAGHDLYLVSCAACHGDSAQGTVNGPAIRDAGPALLDFMMRTGRMPLPRPDAPIVRTQPVLSGDQITAVLAYIATLGGSGPAIPDVAISGADLALGRKLFIANCAACHGAGGAGGAVGNGIVAPGLGRATPVDVGEAVVAGPPPMPRFSFDAPQLNAIAAYVGELQHPASPGGISLAGLGPVPEGLIAGGVGLVGLLVVARWIGASPRRTRSTAVALDVDLDAGDRQGEEPTANGDRA